MGPTYFQDMQEIFAALALMLSPGGTIIVEVSNINTTDGFRPLTSELGGVLRVVLVQTGEISRVNMGDWPAGPGTHHSSLMVFEPRPTK